MSIMWFKENAKWMIWIFGVLILVGLILMDQAGTSMTPTTTDVAVVNGTNISAQSFQEELQAYQQNEAARTGQTPDEMELMQIREQLLRYKIQSILLQEKFDDYNLHASGEEMMDHLLQNPPPQIQQYPVFQTDSVFDPAKFRAWLTQDSVYRSPFMRNLEAQLKGSVIPQLQIQQLLRAQVHQTSLEQGYQVSLRRNQARVKYYYIPLDSVSVDSSEITDQQIGEYFESHPDSFYTSEESARLRYVKLNIRPSPGDTTLIEGLAEQLTKRITEGENFNELAISYSDDPGSAEKGGSLGGYQTREQWVPAFSEAAFALDSGEISQPVLSRFGYHIIKSDGKMEEEGETKVKASHILLKIPASPETVDSLINLANNIREEAISKEDLDLAASKHNLELDTTPIFSEENPTPVGNGYIPGLRSFTFGRMDKNQQISEVLQTDEGIYIFEKLEKFEKGRHLEPVKQKIRTHLIKEKKQEKAVAKLKNLASTIRDLSPDSLPQKVGSASLDSSYGMISSDSWLRGYGYSDPALAKTFQQSENQWGEIRITSQGAVMAILTEKSTVDSSNIESLAGESNLEENDFMVNKMFETWLTQLEKKADIEENMDMLYRY